MPSLELPTTHLRSRDTYRILTLENPENIDKLKEACKKAGHQVFPASTIAQAMQFLDGQDHVDIVIAAVFLQDESVFEFLKCVKQNLVHQDVPFIMLCMEPGKIGLDHSSAADKLSCILGADKYILMQVFDAERLIEEVEKLFPAVPAKESIEAR